MNGIKYRKVEELVDSGVEWLGKMPSDWKFSKIKYISSVFNGATPKTAIEKYWDGNINWYTPTDFKRTFLSDSRKKITTKGLYSCGTRLVPKETVLVTCRAPIGNIGIVKNEFAAFNQGCKSVVPQKTDKKYLFYLLINSVDFLKSNGKGTTFMELSNSDLGDTPINLSLLIEQQKIANFLDYKTSQFDSVINKKEQLILKLEEAKKSLISEVVTGKVKILDGKLVKRDPSEMKDSDVEWLGKIPRNWLLKKLKNVSSIYNGATPKTAIKEYWDGDINWYTPIDFKHIFLRDSRKKITIRGFNSCGTRLVPKGSILLTCRAPIGNVGIIKNDFATFNQGCKSILPEEINTTFLFYLIVYSTDFLKSRGNGTTFLELSNSDLANTPIAISTSAEQTELADYLDTKTSQLDSIIKKQKQLIDKLKQAKQSLISEAVTGKIDLRDWEIIDPKETV